ncbi:Imm61 family immunity protein [Microbacterium arborescens]
MTELFPFQFTPSFIGWVSAAYSVLVSGDRLVVTNDGGEIRDFVGRANQRFVLTHAERAEEEEFTLDTDSLDAIERYLTVQIGRELRDQAQMPRIRIPFAAQDAAPGFAVGTFRDGRKGLRRESGDTVDVRFADTYSAVQYSYYADADLGDLRRSLETPDGAPLFTPFVGR